MQKGELLDWEKQLLTENKTVGFEGSEYTVTLRMC